MKAQALQSTVPKMLSLLLKEVGQEGEKCY